MIELKRPSGGTSMHVNEGRVMLTKKPAALMHQYGTSGT
jgi:hypothetical protein